MAQRTELGIVKEDQRAYLANNDIEVIDFLQRCRIQEEYNHIHENLQDFFLFEVLILLVSLNTLSYIEIYHLDELCLILCIQL